MKRWLIVVGVALVLPVVVSAHPIDELGEIKLYEQKQTLVVAPDKTSLEVQMTFYAFDKVKVWESIDKNLDETASEDEIDQWKVQGQDVSWLENDSGKIAFQAKTVKMPVYSEFFSTKPAVISITYTASPLRRGKNYYHYDGRDKKLTAIPFDARGEGGWGITGISRPSDTTAEFEIQEGSVGGVTLQANISRVERFVNTYVRPDNVSAGFLIFGLAVAFVLGALHALSPGHGKTLVASYLVGEKGTVAQAIYLGLVVTITHTASVFVLGWLSLVVTRYIVPSTVARGLNLISAGLIIALGLTLLWQRVKQLRQHRREHSLNLEHDHHHHEEWSNNAVNWKSLLAMGISGGIVPCVDALAILIVAISISKIMLGMMLLVAFSAGLAAALIGAGLIVVTAKRAVGKKMTNMSKLEPYLGIISACIITLLGLALLANVKI